MVKKLVPGRNFNIDIYWDTIDVDSGLAVGSVVDTIAISKGSLVQSILAYVLQEAEGSGTVTFVVGDPDDSDGFLLSQDLVVAKEQLYGNDPDDLGVYLKSIRPFDSDYTELTPVTPHDQLLGKFYKADTTIRVVTTVATAAMSTSGKVRVWAKIIRLITKED